MTRPAVPHTPDRPVPGTDGPPACPDAATAISGPDPATRAAFGGYRSIVTALVALLRAHSGRWAGRVTDLYASLDAHRPRGEHWWPPTPRGLSTRLSDIDGRGGMLDAAGVDLRRVFDGGARSLVLTLDADPGTARPGERRRVLSRAPRTAPSGRIAPDEVVTPQDADHGLGSPAAALRRVADAVDRALGGRPGATVPLDVPGGALVAPTRARFDPDDPGDVEVLCRVLRLWAPRLVAHRLELRAVAPDGLAVGRCPAQASAEAIPWSSAAPRRDLARWARRAAQQASQQDAEVPVADGPPVEPGADGRARVAAIRATVPEWPPPIETAHGLGGRAGRPRRIELGGLTPLPGCTSSTRRPCVRAPGGVVRCPRCGRCESVAEPVAGARLLGCDCWGDGGLCVHPVPRQAVPGVAR